MLKLILKTSLVFCLANLSSSSSQFFSQSLVRNYSTSPTTPKILNSLNPLKIYSSLQQPSKRKQLLNDLANQGGIVLFYSKPTSLYAIEGSGNLAGYLQDLFNKEMLKLLANIKIPKAIQKKTKIQLKTHYQELLKSDWKDYDLYLLESWDRNKASPTEERLAYYHAKYQPKLNLMRYVALANGKIEMVYQWNHFKTEEEMLAKSQKKASTKPLLTYRIDNKSPLDKLKAKVYYENKDKVGVYRWINRINKQSYIGSSLNLGQVLYALQLDKITTNSKDYLLNQALKTDGLTSFNLQILAYCSLEELTEKEQYYLQLFNPEYNINQENKEDQLIIDNSLNKQLVLFQPLCQGLTVINPSPGVSLIPLEVKPSSLLIIPESIKESIIEAKTKKWTLSEATRQKQSLARQQRKKQPNPGFKIKVRDLVENQTIIYSSCGETSRALNINRQAISNYLINKQTKPYKKRYIFTKL